MELIVGGGYGEHGRTCFLIKAKSFSFLLDCGVMAGDPSTYPRLTGEQISGAEFLFLTHSHADHAGALPWLSANGFDGRVILTRATWEQLEFKPKAPAFLEECSGRVTRELSVSWGRSGHCAGSVWYRLELEGEVLLFSGDYVEDTLVYRCDPIHGQKADLAILDCAYAEDERSSVQNRAAVKNFLERSVQDKIPLLLPVPKYGRGLELLAMIASLGGSTPVYADAVLRGQLQDIAAWGEWRKEGAERLLSGINARPFAEWDAHAQGFLLVSDPQLKNEKSRTLSRDVLAAGGQILLTGSQDAGSYSKELLQTGRAAFQRYSVHQNQAEMRALVSANEFGRVIPFHCRRTFPDRDSL